MPQESRPDTVCHECGQPIRVTRQSLSGKAMAMLGAAASAFYLFNPGMGILEFLPDNIPFIGNLDEGAATALLIYCLNYLGVKFPAALIQKLRRKEEKRIIK